MTQLNLNEILALIAQTEFKAFTEGDWYAFSGCETETPFIGYNGDFTIVMDGVMINIIHAEDEFGGQLFALREF
jgi:hypothetical protein